MACPECQVFRGTGAQVVVHMQACRARLHQYEHQAPYLRSPLENEMITCPECHKKLGSQALLIVHVLQCLRGDAVAARKRPREDNESWKPTRNRNNKNEVKWHWQKNHVQDWLRLVELEEYGKYFEKAGVDGRILMQLKEEDFVKMGVFATAPTHAAKFLELRDAFS